MNFCSAPKLVALVAIAVTSIGVSAQTIRVNGTTCSTAAVTFRTGTIDIDTAACTSTQTAPTITSAAPPSNARVGLAYGPFSVTATGNPAPTFSLAAANSLPAGLSLAANGTISGTPTAAGTSMFQVVATNGVGSPATSPTYTVTVTNSPAITNLTLAAATINSLYSHTFTATQVIPANGWTSTGLPTWATLNASTGQLSGTPTAAATHNFSVTATNANGSDTQAVTLVVNGSAVAPTITSAAPAAGIANTAYSHTFVAGTGTAPITWSVSMGTLPAGLSLNSSTGVLSGTPTAAATTNFTVQAMNTAGSNTQAVSLVINPDNSGAMGTRSVENVLIPTPSKDPNIAGFAHDGLSGGGDDIRAPMRAWAVNPSRCSNTTPAILRSWHHNINFATYTQVFSTDYPQLAPNEALTYEFIPATLGVGKIILGETATIPLAPSFLSLSTMPCDFDVSKANNGTGNYCYTSQPRDNTLFYEVTNGNVSFILNCKLVPGQKYYLNLRFQDARPANMGGSPTSDSCAAIGQAKCGGLLRFAQ